MTILNTPFQDELMKLKIMNFNQSLNTFPTEFYVSDFVNENDELIPISTKEFLIKLIEERFGD